MPQLDDRTIREASTNPAASRRFPGVAGSRRTPGLAATNGIAEPKSSPGTSSDSDQTRTDLTGQTAPPGLAFEADILAVFRRDVARLGLAGEATAACLIYLALTSRLLPWGNPGERPVSVIPKGASATGKSHTTKTVLRFFPPDAYLDLGSMSKRISSTRRSRSPTESSSSPSGSCLPRTRSSSRSCGRCSLRGRWYTERSTPRGSGGRRGRSRRRDRPGLLITTTAALVDPELETRCLSFVTDDSPEQTRAIFETIARLENEEMPNGLLDEWLQLQAWLASHGPALVTIPYVTALAGLMPTSAARLRRDFVTLLSLIRAHAALHRATRATDDRGRIVATLGDYEAVRDLVEQHTRRRRRGHRLTGNPGDSRGRP